MSKIESWLRRHFRHKELGWADIGEVFTRFTVLRTPFFSVYLHKLDAPVPHPHCHDHPWHFWTLILAGGYHEWAGKGVSYKFRGPGTILYRTAKFSHIVVTNGAGWSLIVASPKVRSWGFLVCT